jgi:outer membrane protein assembly factor BamB
MYFETDRTSLTRGLTRQVAGFGSATFSFPLQSPAVRYRMILTKRTVAAVRWSLMIAATLAAAALPAQEKKSDPLDWPHWRGPEMNGISREKGLVSSWSPDGENVLWKAEEYGSRSTPIVMNGKLYTLCRLHPETTKEQERVVCLDAATGEKIWENAFNVFLTDAPAERVAWSNVAGDPESGNVFALGICDYFQCIDGTTGKTLWSHSLSEEYGMISTYGGRTNMPLVFEDVVIISGVMTGWGEHAVPAHRFVAFDKRTGQAVWLMNTRLRPLDTTYSTPVLGVFNGQAAFVAGAGDGSVYAIQPRTGKIIWHYDASIRGINTPPVIAGNMVFCGHSEENLFDTTIMGAVFAIDGTGTGDLTDVKGNWLQPTKMVGRAQPLFVNDRLYVVDDSATLMVLDPKTGKEIGKQKLGRSMFGSPIYADGKIYLGEANGLFYILEPTEKGVKIVHRARVEGAMIQGSPIVSHGRLYIPTNTALYCVGTKDHTPSADPAPTPPPETPSSADQKPAQLQLVPVESLLKPGQRQSFQARLYNANGRYLKTEMVDVKFELQGPGKIDAKGEFTAPGDAGHAATIVTAKVGELTGSARIRTIPPFPWSFDFNDQQIPETWIGAGYRHIALDDDLFASLNARNPRAAGLYIYLTTQFTNFPAPVQKFEDASPRRTWTALLRYFDLDGEGKPATIDEAKKQFDEALQLLVQEKVSSGPTTAPAASN